MSHPSYSRVMQPGSPHRASFWIRSKLVQAANLIARRGSHFGTGRRPFPLLESFKESLQSTPGPDVLLFGDSVFERVAYQDGDRRPLGSMLVDRLTELGMRPHVLTHSSYTPYMYEAFLRLAERLGAHPRCIILSFNLRCCSLQWDASPLWQFTQDHAAVEAQIIDPSAAVVPLKPVFEHPRIYDAVAFASPLSSRRTIGEFTAIARKKPKTAANVEARKRELLVFHYGVPIRREHRNLSSLTAAVRAAVDLRAKTLVYLTPINLPLIRRIGGPGFVDIIRANSTLVRDAVHAGAGSSEVIWRDWLAAMPSTSFFHEQELTEHLCTEGRQRLTDLVSDTLLRQPTRSGEAAAYSSPNLDFSTDRDERPK